MLPSFFSDGMLYRLDVKGLSWAAEPSPPPRSLPDYEKFDRVLRLRSNVFDPLKSLSTGAADTFSFKRDWLRYIVLLCSSVSFLDFCTGFGGSSPGEKDSRFTMRDGLPILPVPDMKPAALRCSENMTISVSVGRAV